MQKEPTMSPEEEEKNNDYSPESKVKKDSPFEASNPSLKKNPASSKKDDSKIEIDLDSLPLVKFPEELEKILKDNNWLKLGELFRKVTSEFETRFAKELAEKKDAFLKDGGNEIDFYYAPEYKKKFSLFSREYKRKKSEHYRELEKNQKLNLERKKEIIEQIKNLVDNNQNNNSIYNEFKNLQEAFRSTGQVPRSELNNIWQTYKFHVERFYDFLHLDRELREIDYKHNYKEKLKIIERIESLANKPDITAASRELNTLHRLWKNDLGPVAKEHREELWKRLQEASNVIRNLQNQYNKNIDSIQSENLKLKEDVLNRMVKAFIPPPKNHNSWQNAVKNINKLKEEFHGIGSVSKKENKQIWDRFRSVTRQFNKGKNDFYKQQKSQEKEFVLEKRNLIKEIKNILEDPDYRSYFKRMIAIQDEWKNSGRVSRKLSTKLWKEFKTSTNLYFDKLRNKSNAFNEKDQAANKIQQKFYDNLIKQKAPTTPKKLEDFINNVILDWQSIDSQPNQAIQKKLLSHLNGLLNETSLTKKEKEKEKFNTYLKLIKEDEDALNKEYNLIRKKIADFSNELIQLQNNLQFFSNSSSDNPLVSEVNTKIKKLSEMKESLEHKINAIKTLKRTLKKNQETSMKEDERSLDDKV